MKGSMEICDMVQSVAAIIQQHGQHDFPSSASETDGDIRTAQLCGLTVYVENAYVVRITGHDMDVVLNSYYHRAANDQQVVDLKSYSHYSFLKGDAAELEGWLGRLMRFQSVFRHAPVTAAAIAEKGNA